MSDMHDSIAAQRDIVDEFGMFPEWLDRYQYLIDLGRKLPPLRESELVDENLLDGCQSRVWLLIDGDADRVRIRANSDAAIVSGLIALLIRVYSGATARQILDTEPFFIRELGLDDHLSPTRANGLHAMLQAIKGSAAALAA
jgi:cysteine desulfuration protein SufE